MSAAGQFSDLERGLPGEVGQRAKSIGQIAAVIGDQETKQAYDQGTRLSISRAIDLALGRRDDEELARSRR